MTRTTNPNNGSFVSDGKRYDAKTTLYVDHDNNSNTAREACVTTKRWDYDNADRLVSANFVKVRVHKQHDGQGLLLVVKA
jgi:hypothetical protein